VKSTGVEAAIVKSIPVESGHRVKSTAMESTAAVETPAPAMRAGIGEVWLAERGRAKQSPCDCQSPPYLRPGVRFA